MVFGWRSWQAQVQLLAVSFGTETYGNVMLVQDSDAASMEDFIVNGTDDVQAKKKSKKRKKHRQGLWVGLMILLRFVTLGRRPAQRSRQWQLTCGATAPKPPLRPLDQPESVKDALAIFGEAYLNFRQTQELADEDVVEREQDYDPEGDRDVASPIKRRTGQKNITEAYAIEEIEAQYLSSRDDVIREVDIPERIQLQFGDFVNRQPCEEGEALKEAEWIYKNAFSAGNRMSRTTDPILNKFYRDDRDETRFIGAIAATVNLMRWDSDRGDAKKQDIDFSGPRDVPFIAQYRKEAVNYPEILNMHDLWEIKYWDERWFQLQNRKHNLRAGFGMVQDYQTDMMRKIREFAQEKYREDMSISNDEIKQQLKTQIPGMDEFASAHTESVDILIDNSVVDGSSEANPELDDLWLVREMHFELIDEAKSEVELNDIADYFRLHLGGDEELARTSREKMLAWLNHRASEWMLNFSKVTDFDESWRSGIAFRALVYVYARLKSESTGQKDEEHKRLRDFAPTTGSPETVAKNTVENFWIAQEEAEKLGVDLGFDAIDFCRCKNPYHRLRRDYYNILLGDIVSDEHDRASETVSVCSVNRLDSAVVVKTLRLFMERCVEMEMEIGIRGQVPELVSVTAPRGQGKASAMYEVCKKAGVLSVTKDFGLTAEQIGGNLRDHFMNFVPIDSPKEPLETAEDYTGSLGDAEKVLKLAQNCLALEIAHDPLVRDTLRQVYLGRVTVTVRPTPPGKTSIEDWHPYARYKYLTHKLVKHLKDDDYLWITKAVKEGVLTVTFSAEPDAEACQRLYLPITEKFWEDVEASFCSDSTDMLSTQWNDIRRETLRIAITKYLFPLFEKEVRQRLREEAIRYVIECCANAVRVKINRAPFQTFGSKDEDEEDEGVRVIAFNLAEDNEDTSIAAILDGKGEVVDHSAFQWLLLSKNSSWAGDGKRRSKDWEKLRRMVIEHAPELAVIGVTGRKCEHFQRDFDEMLASIYNEFGSSATRVSTELEDVRLARIFSTSDVGKNLLKDYDARLRTAIMLGRQMQSPQLAYASVCNRDMDILSLDLHPLKSMVPPKKLMEALEQELITVINRSGMDINAAVVRPHVALGIPFIAGLGNRKAVGLLDAIRASSDTNSRLYSREQLLDPSLSGIGPVVARVCSGFLYFAADSTVTLGCTPLDSTRIHPANYDIATKIAKDALGIVPNQQDGDTGLADEDMEAISDVLHDPTKLSGLNLDDFAGALKEMGFGDLTKTVQDIRAEFENPFRDTRLEYKPPNTAQLFE